MFTTIVCAVLSAVGVAVACLTAYRRRFATAARVAACSLLPVGLAMTGLVTLGAELGQAVGEWGMELALDPLVGAGSGVLGCAALLWVGAWLSQRRAVARPGPTERGRPTSGMPPSADRTTRGVSQDGQRGRAESGGLDDFSEIETILKKHGI